MSFSSPLPDIEIPNISVYQSVFGDLTETDLARTALVDAKTGDKYDYQTLKASVDAFAGALAAEGIGVGDVVAIVLPNSPFFAIAFHGILRAGATVTTVNALFTGGEIAKQLRDSQATMLITCSALAAGALAGAAEMGLANSAVMIADGAGLTGAEPSGGTHPNAADYLAKQLAPPEVSFDPATHLAALPYSSGTTGNPKGVMLTHRNLVANVRQCQEIIDMKNDDVVIAVLPFFHIYGLTVLLNSALTCRASLVIMPKFDLVEFLENIQNHRVTYGFIAPPVAVALAKHPIVDNYDLSSIRSIMSGAAPLDAELGQAVEQRLNLKMMQGYGLSELSPVSHCIPRDTGVALLGRNIPLSSSGILIPNTINKLVNPETGVEINIPTAGLSDPGELWVKGPNVMAGYLGNAEATAATIDAEGFLHTGDLARVDDSGCIYLVDRIKELIKYKGYQVPPAELEALLLTNPKIADAAVIGVIEAETGEEIPKAFVVKQPNVDLTETEVMEFVAAQVAPHKKVRQVEFIELIPKSAAGKILRRELRQ